MASPFNALARGVGQPKMGDRRSSAPPRSCYGNHRFHRREKRAVQSVISRSAVLRAVLHEFCTPNWASYLLRFPFWSVSLCQALVTFPIIYQEPHIYCVSIQSIRSAADPENHGASVGILGKSWAGCRRRELFFFR